MNDSLSEDLCFPSDTGKRWQPKHEAMKLMGQMLVLKTFDDVSEHLIN